MVEVAVSWPLWQMVTMEKLRQPNEHTLPYDRANASAGRRGHSSGCGGVRVRERGAMRVQNARVAKRGKGITKEPLRNSKSES